MCDQLSAFAAGAAQFFVISFPMYQMKTKVQIIWSLASVLCLTSSCPVYALSNLSAQCGLSSAVEGFPGSFGAKEGLNLHLGCTDSISRNGEQMHKSLSAGSPAESVEQSQVQQ